MHQVIFKIENYIKLLSYIIYAHVAWKIYFGTYLHTEKILIKTLLTI